MKNLNYKAGKTPLGNDRIEGFEPYFNTFVWVGRINHAKKEISPSHGYFYPHNYGKRMKAKAKKLGYTFKN